MFQSHIISSSLHSSTLNANW